jgi:hypothetical protein
MEKGLGAVAPRPFKKRKKVSLRPALPPKRTGLTHCPEALLPRRRLWISLPKISDNSKEAGVGFIHLFMAFDGLWVIVMNSIWVV